MNEIQVYFFHHFSPIGQMSCTFLVDGLYLVSFLMLNFSHNFDHHAWGVNLQAIRWETDINNADFEFKV